MPTLSPMSRKPSARLTAVVDLPTPPLPDATAMIAFTPSGAWAELGPPRAPLAAAGGGRCALPGPGARCAPGALPAPGARSAVSATMADWTPGTARTAVSAALRTGSQRWTAAASTLMEKNTLPSVVTTSERTPAWVSSRPSGAGTLFSASTTCSFVTAMLPVLKPGHPSGTFRTTYGIASRGQRRTGKTVDADAQPGTLPSAIDVWRKTMAKVAFLGLGVMGYPMAGHLKNKGGHDVTV